MFLFYGYVVMYMYCLDQMTVVCYVAFVVLYEYIILYVFGGMFGYCLVCLLCCSCCMAYGYGNGYVVMCFSCMLKVL